MFDNPDEPPKKVGEILVGTDLTILLDSLMRGGAMSHYRTAKVIQAALDGTSSLDEKRLFAAEIFCKLMQSLEDLGAFCLFCLNGKQSDISKYFNASTRGIVEFYGRCRAGLSDNEIDEIYGIPNTTHLVSSGKLALSQREAHEKVLRDIREKFRSTLKNKGSVFAGYDAKTKKYGGYSDLVNMYFNTKHGVRVFLPNPAQAKEMAVADTDVAILIGARKDPVEDRIGIEIGSFSLEAIPGILENINATGTYLKQLAEIRLAVEKDPFFVFGLMREGRREVGTVEGILKPERNRMCFCGSNIKFKKCHGR